MTKRYNTKKLYRMQNLGRNTNNQNAQQWALSDNYRHQTIRRIIEHIVKAEYDIFVQLILTQVFFNTSGEKTVIKHEKKNMPRTSWGFSMNNIWATKGITEKAFVPLFMI
jgi:hypothetical protein